MSKMEDSKMLYGEITTRSLQFSRKGKDPRVTRFLLPLEIYTTPSLGIFIVLIAHKN